MPENLSYGHSKLTLNLTMHNSGFPYCDFRGICSVRILTSVVLLLLPQTYTNVFALLVNQLDIKKFTANRQNYDMHGFEVFYRSGVNMCRVAD